MREGERESDNDREATRERNMHPTRVTKEECRGETCNTSNQRVREGERESDSDRAATRERKTCIQHE